MPAFPRTSSAVARTFWLVLLVAGLVLGAVPTAVAEPSEEELQQQIQEAQEAEDALQGDLGDAERQLRDLEADFSLAVDRYNRVAEELEQLESEIESAEREVERYRNRAEQTRARIGRSARKLYMDGGAGELPALLAAGELSDVARRLVLAEAARTTRLADLEAYRSDQRRVEAGVARLEDARAAADAKRRQLQQRREEIEEKVAGQRDDIQRLQAEIDRQADLRTEREAELAELRAERARQAAADRARREEAARQAASGTASSARSSGGSSSSDAPTGASVGSAGAAPAAPPASGRAAVAVQTALAQVGKPYQWGGSGPDSFDCSGLTSYAWRAAGVSLPHNSGMQYSATARVSQSQLQPGDLVFYYSPISHVAMYIGDGMVVEAPYTGAAVRVAPMNRPGYVGAGRPS